VGKADGGLRREKGLRYSRKAMNLLSLIEAKRDGAALRPAEIQGLVREFTAGRLPDYQMSAFLMAVFFRGLDPEETRALTLA
jgi:thymidine phosphorylase